MKYFRYILCCLFILFTITTKADNVDKVYRTIKKQPNVEKVNLGWFTMTLAGCFTDTMGVKKIKVITSPISNTKQHKTIKECIKNLRDKKYDVLLSVNDNKEKVRILGKISRNKKKIKELVIIACDAGECTMVRLYGNMKIKDITKLQSKYNDK